MEMVKTKVIAFAGCILLLASCSPSFSWNRIVADGSRTGVKPVTIANASEALGSVEDGVYTAPSQRVFENGATPKVAADLIEVQPQMRDLKQIVGYAPRAMESHRPQSELSNFTVDTIMEGVEAVTGRKVDVGITNFGGIRCDVPQGEVLKDDFVSMFPFKNYLCYVKLSGRRLREIYTAMVENRSLQVLGGVELVVSGDKIESITIGGEPLDDERSYGLATIDFLLKTGDNLHLGDDALEVVVSDTLIIDYILPKIVEMGKRGEAIEYHLDNRIVIK